MNRRTSSQTNAFALRKFLLVWLKQHALACIFSLGQFFKTPLNSLLTTAVIGIALSLPAGFYLVLENCQRIAAGWDNSARISLFLQTQVDEENALLLADNIRSLDSVTSVDYISSEQALKEYQNHSGMAEWLDVLDENPLPAVLLVQPSLPHLDGTEKQQLLTALRSLEGVDTVQFDRQWIQRLFAIITIVEHAVAILSVLLAIAVLLIVGNTIRLAIYNRRTEIEINKLFGATEAFVQRPFLYSGFFHGLGGSILAWCLLSMSLLLLDQPVMDLARLYSSDFQLQGLSSYALLTLFSSGATLGLAGSWVSVQRHIRSIEPA